jgi:hypothetical protein
MEEKLIRQKHYPRGKRAPCAQPWMCGGSRRSGGVTKKQEGIKSATETPELKDSAVPEDQRQGEVLAQKTEWRKIQRQRKKNLGNSTNKIVRMKCKSPGRRPSEHGKLQI